MKNKLFSFFKKNKDHKILFYFLFLLFFTICIYVFFQIQKQNRLIKRAEKIFTLAEKSKNFRKRNRFFISLYEDKKTFLQDRIENLVFKQKEIKDIETKLKIPFLNNRKYLKRLKFLKEKNKIFFTEKILYKNSFLQETQKIFQGKLEIEDEDIKRILSLIEKVDIDNFSSVPSPFYMVKNIEISNSKKGLFIKNLTLVERRFFNK